MKKAIDAWLPVARGAVTARDGLRSTVLPAVRELARIAPEGRARELALVVHDGVYAAVGALVLALKGRGTGKDRT